VEQEHQLQRSPGGLVYLQFADHPRLVAAFSTRHGGVSAGPFATLNLGGATADRQEAVAENRRRFFATAAELEPDRVVGGAQIHGNGVALVEEGRRPRAGGSWASLDRADALITAVPGMGLAAFYADCTPVLLIDPRGRGIGVVHAGWRGSAAGVALRAVQAMTGALGIPAGDLRAVIGPCIGPCCYEVGPEVAREFSGHGGAGRTVVYIDRVAGGGTRHRVDLAAANRAQLIRAGVPAARIQSTGLCTACRRDLFFSHRADGGRTGRMSALVALRPAG